jgi:predicted metalloprotease
MFRRHAGREVQIDPPQARRYAVRIARRVRPLPLALTIVLMLTAGCVIGGGVSRDDGSGRGAADPTASAVSPQEINKTVRRAQTEIEQYWRVTYPKLTNGRPFTPIKGGFHAYTRSQPAPACGGERTPYQPNAFYCPAGDFIAWDAETLIPQLYNQFGGFLVAVVFAHEYGHAIQQRLNPADQPTIVLEQQADCFAGSWASASRGGGASGGGEASGGPANAGSSGGAASASGDPTELDRTIAGMLLLRDQPGTSALSEGAHGNAFDRIRAFQEGFEQSATKCANYRVGTIPVTEIAFTSREEAATGGDLPYDEALDLLTQDVQAYWSRTFPELSGGTQWKTLRVVTFDPAKAPKCNGKARSEKDATGAAFYCESDDYVAFDGKVLGPTLYRRIGDNAIGMVMADLFARAAQHRRGEATTGREAQLTIDCLAGAWTYDILHRGQSGGASPNGGIRLSPGDLDEAVNALLTFGRAGKTSGTSAFDRIGAFRNGVLQGLPACG